MEYVIICRYIPQDPSIYSETYHYKKGANQLFSQTSHVFDPTSYNEDDLTYNADKEVLIHIFIYAYTKYLYFVHI